ncbi:MAG: hypothetical protein JNJ41_00560 [Bacteroidia bacterium]|nr:hypothetical protein [Bacteroidia bacterium]
MKNTNPDRQLKQPSSEYFSLAMEKFGITNLKYVTFLPFNNNDPFFDPFTGKVWGHGVFVNHNTYKRAEKYLDEYFFGLRQRRKYLLFYQEIEIELWKKNIMNKYLNIFYSRPP